MQDRTHLLPFNFLKLSSLIVCSIRQASSSARIGSVTKLTADNGLNWGVAKLPNVNPDDKGGACIGGASLAMFNNGDDAKANAAWEFIKYIESPEALAKWSTGTGYLPPRKGVADDPNGFKKMIEENKNIQVALSTMPNLVKWASFPGANGLQAEQLLIDARDIILSGKETAAQALHETAEKINNLL